MPVLPDTVGVARAVAWVQLGRLGTLVHAFEFTQNTTSIEEASADLLRRKPGFRTHGRCLIGRWIKCPALMDRIVEWLALAGLSWAWRVGWSRDGKRHVGGGKPHEAGSRK